VHVAAAAARQQCAGQQGGGATTARVRATTSEEREAARRSNARSVCAAEKPWPEMSDQLVAVDAGGSSGSEVRLFAAAAAVAPAARGQQQPAKDEGEEATAVERVRADIARISSDDPGLSVVDWRRMGVNDGHVVDLAHALRDNSHVHQVLLSRNSGVDAAGAQALLEVLGASTVEWVALSRTSVSKELRAAVARQCLLTTVSRVARNDCTLTAVEWAKKGVDDALVAKLAEGLGNNDHVKRVNLEHNPDFSDIGAKPLASVLRNGRCAVEWVGLSFSGVSTVGKQQLLSLCFRNTASFTDIVRRVAQNDPELHKVDWRDADADDEMLHTLVQGIRTNTHLQRLDLRDNPRLTDAALDSLRGVLDGSSIAQVRLSGCDGVSAPMKEAIKRLCYRVKIKRSLVSDASTQPQ
jgi:hypothetical protein